MKRVSGIRIQHFNFKWDRLCQPEEGSCIQMRENKWVTVYIAGDSTAANYPEDKRPMSGWGEWIASYLTDEVRVSNRARNGRSSKSFIAEGHFERIASSIGKGTTSLSSSGITTRSRTRSGIRIPAPPTRSI